MTDVKDRLTRLVGLAEENTPEKQRVLAFELCDLLFDWPERYPHAMREPFESLLEKVLGRLDGTTRRLISTRLASRPDTSLSLLNEFYFDLPPEARIAVLTRNDEPCDDEDREIEEIDEAVLLTAARESARTDFASAFAHALQVSAGTADRILDDATGHALAIACKGARITRATYSGLALLELGTGAQELVLRRLSAFDEISATAARRVLRRWREMTETSANSEAV